MADPAQMQQLALLLGQTVAPNSQAMASATQQLSQAESQPTFGLLLLSLLQSGGCDAAAQQAGAIYFKNHIRRQWCVESGGISLESRASIKQNLFTLMLQAPKAVQLQLAAALEEISISDYPADWLNLLPEIVNQLKTSQDVKILKGTMSTADSVFKKFRKQARSDDLLREVKYTVTEFQETHLMVYKATAQQILSGSLVGEQLQSYVELLLSAVNIFFSLNVVDLPEFYEDNRESWLNGFLAILRYTNPALSGTGAPGLLENLKAEVCECLTLYADKYQEEFQPYLTNSVKGVWELLMSLSQDEKDDQLAARGIHFLASCSKTRWQNSPFDDPNVLSGICEKVVFANIFLRDSDVETFEDNPLEYITRDMEGADQESRRQSSMDLVKALGRLNEAKVTEILMSYIRNLLEQSKTASPQQAERYKEACIYLVIAMAVRGQTARGGVTIVNENVDVVDFFCQQLAPELVAEPLTQKVCLRASCLKFIAVFRNQIPKDKVMAVFANCICRHLLSESAVIHTYAAICIEKLLTVKDHVSPAGVRTPRYDAAALGQTLLGAVDPMLQIIATNKGIPQNPYLMRTISRIFAFLKQGGANAALPTLQRLAAIVIAVSANPTNPVFNHHLFEAIAAIVKIAVPAHTDMVEQALMPACGVVLERNVTDFLPYTFQILGLLLDATSSVKPLYVELFGRLLNLDLWRAHANVPGLVRLLRAYFAKHQIFVEQLKTNMQSILERFQLIFQNRKTEQSAFDLLNAMVKWLPLEIYQQYFNTLLTVLLARLQAKKTPKLQKDFVIALSLLSHQHPAGFVPSALNSVQPGLLDNILGHVWLPAMKMMRRLDEKKICALGLAKVIAQPDIAQKPPLLLECCKGLVLLLGIGGAGTDSKVADAEDGSDDEEGDLLAAAGQEYEVSFNKLRNTDLGQGNPLDLAPEVPDTNSAVKMLLASQGQSILQLAQSNPDMQGLVAFLR